MISFSKYHGTGNDFILIDDRKRTFHSESSLISFLCDRRFGIGADGLVLLQNSTTSDLRMRIFNSDGKEAACCGNAIFCLLSFAFSIGYPYGKHFIEAKGQIVEGYIHKEYSKILFSHPKSIQLFTFDKQRGYLVNTGVDHLVLFVENIASLDVNIEGACFRYHPKLAPEGANINFVERKEETLCIRTYERGVEGETLSCGTGAIAAAFVTHAIYSGLPAFQVFFIGGKMGVEIKKEKIMLQSKATSVFQGVVDISRHNLQPIRKNIHS